MNFGVTYDPTTKHFIDFHPFPKVCSFCKRLSDRDARLLLCRCGQTLGGGETGERWWWWKCMANGRLEGWFWVTQSWFGGEKLILKVGHLHFSVPFSLFLSLALFFFFFFLFVLFPLCRPHVIYHPYFFLPPPSLLDYLAPCSRLDSLLPNFHLVQWTPTIATFPRELQLHDEKPKRSRTELSSEKKRLLIRPASTPRLVKKKKY